MASIDPPRTAIPAARRASPEDRRPVEPPTDRALWPTFLRRTLEDQQVRPAAPEPRPAA
jgi:hypothetical protein